MTRLNSTARGQASRLAVPIVPLAILVVALTACSSSASGGTNTAEHHSAAPGAAAPSASKPASAAAVSASGLSGTWHGRYSGAYAGTFVLRWRQSGQDLSGRIHISNPSSSLPIHGKLADGSIRFGTVGLYRISYTGTVSGNSMSGNWQLKGPDTGGAWSASRG